MSVLHVTDTRIAGVLEIRPKAWTDDRGLFKETFVSTKYRKAGIRDEFVQDSVSKSHGGVLRGLHADPLMSKLVQVLWGRAFDVVVDARANSRTFGQWQGFYLDSDEHTQIYIPAGCLHGFLALTDDVVFSYKQSAEYAPDREVGVRWDDRDIAIEWPLPGPPVVSAKDAAHPGFLETFRPRG